MSTWRACSALRMRTARLRLGEEFIELTEYLAPEGTARARRIRMANDRWFQHIAIIVSDMDRAYQRLRSNKVAHASTGPQRLAGLEQERRRHTGVLFSGSGWALPGGSRVPRRQGKSPSGIVDRTSLFLGIDHTAIVISDTEPSLRFYRDVLGLEVAGESENYGSEQERLNNVFGARLQITSLRAAAGPGIEFLEYLAPRDGRPYPPGEKANDLIHWQTKILGGSAAEAEMELRKARSAFDFDRRGALPASGGYRKSIVVRDPDGHAVQIVEQLNPHRKNSKEN